MRPWGPWGPWPLWPSPGYATGYMRIPHEFKRRVCTGFFFQKVRVLSPLHRRIISQIHGIGVDAALWTPTPTPTPCSLPRLRLRLRLRTPATEHELINFMDNVTDEIEKGNSIIGMYLEIKKAFASVDLQKKIKKLSRYVVRGQLPALVNSYLANRKQKVELIDGNGRYCFLF